MLPRAADAPTLRAWSVLVALPAVGCVSYDCAEYITFDHTLVEQCGPLGAFGVYYFEEGVAEVFLEADFEGDFDSPDADFWMETMPGVHVVFDAAVLDDLGAVQPIEATCRRRECWDCLSEYWALTDLTMEIGAPSDDTALGGQSWEMSWDYTCPPEASMSGTGADVIEFSMESTGYYTDPPPYFEAGR